MQRATSPPINYFTGEDPGITLREWLPSLQTATNQNEWSDEETFIQLAGHLRGRVQWELIDDGCSHDWRVVAKMLQNRLEHGQHSMAAQEFRHLGQGLSESASEFIVRLERTFRIAYGKSGMSLESKEALLHDQMEEGLLLKLMESPAVSGALDYKGLCLAARNKEQRQMELKKRRAYLLTLSRNQDYDRPLAWKNAVVQQTNR